MNKLKTMMLLLLVLGCLGLGGLLTKNMEAGQQAKAERKETKPEKVLEDAESLQGEWQVVDAERDGKAPREDPTSMLITFEGSEIFFAYLPLPENKDKVAKFKLDPGKSPKEMNVTLLGGSSKNLTVRYLYSLEKGELKLCMPLGPKSSDAKEFKTKAGDGLLLLVLRRPKSIPPVNVKREWQRPNAPPDGNYKLSIVDRGGFECNCCLIKLETKDEKQSVNLLDTTSDFAGVTILQSVITATPPFPPPIPTGKVPPQAVHIRITFKTPALGEEVFDGDFLFGSLEARGSLETNQRIFPATLSASDLAKLKFTDRDIRPALLSKALSFENTGWFLRQKAQQAKDPTEKTRLLKEADLADLGKKGLAEVPILYKDVFEKYADHPAVFYAALNMVKIAAKYEMPADQVRGMVAKADKAAATYGRIWRLDFNTQIADALVSQKAYAAVALDIAARLEKLLLSSDSAETRARVLKTVAAAQGNAGNVAKMEEILDREYRARLPLIKVESFTGRQTKSDRIVVLELFTGAQCGPCVAADIAFDLTQKTYKPAELILLQYHLHIPGPDPLANADSEARWEYYKKSFPDKVRGVPTAVFGGNPEASGGGGMEKAEAKYQQFRQVIDPLLEIDSGAKLVASAVKQGNKINVTVSVTDLVKPGGDTRLRLLLVEESIRYVGGNQVRFHHQVVRKLVGGADGFPLKDKDSKHAASVDVNELRKSLSDYLDDYHSNTRPFPNSDRPLNFDNLRLIALVQDDATRAILQAAQVEITEAKAAPVVGWHAP